MNAFDRARVQRRGPGAPWILVAVGLAVSAVASAQTVYKCVDSENRIAFQQTPCQAGQRESEVAIKPSPPPPPPPPPSRPAPSREGALAAREYMANLAREAEPAPVQSAPVVQSYQCTIVTGEVFYRHSRCPDGVRNGTEMRFYRYTGAVESGPHYVAVTESKPVPRSFACQEMRSAGRSGRKYDEQISTYDKNLGRDPCKNY